MLMTFFNLAIVKDSADGSSMTSIKPISCLIETMVNLPPNPNGSPTPNDREPTSRLRDNDEMIAVLLAFLGLGTILFWGWTRSSERNLFGALPSTPLADRPLIAGEAPRDEDEIDGNDRFEPWIPFSNNSNETLQGELEENRIAANEQPLRREISSLTPRQMRQEVPEAVVIAPGASNPDASNVTTDEPSEPASETPPPLSISDVPEDYWAYPYIVSLHENGFLPDLPEGQLQPDKPLTRAEFAALLNSSFVGQEARQRSLSFTDVSANFWAADAIEQVVDAGYMTGYPGDTFQPAQLVPRYQVLVTLASGLNLTPPADPEAVLNRFQGHEALPGWSVRQVAAAVENDLLVNYPDPQKLAPEQPATRAEIIVLLHQALHQQGKVEAVTDSPYVNPGK